MNQFQQGEGCSRGPAGRPIDSVPAPAPTAPPASTAALSPAGDAGQLTVDGSQPGFTLSAAEIELAYHTLRSFPDRRDSVGALLQVGGLGALAVKGVHVLETASEDFRDVGKLTQEFGKVTQDLGRPHADR